MPFKDFTAGDILTAVDVDSLLMRQTIMTFADSAARDTALSAVLAEGMFCYLNDTNAFQVYDGSAWADVSNPGDITAVTAGTALTGGGTSGAVTLNVDLAAVHTADFVTDATTARTLTSADAGKTILFTSGSATVVTVDASTDFPVGQRADIIADGAGAVTVTADTATVAADGTATTSGSFTIGDQYSAATLICVATDEYRLIGNVAVV
jgi:uncharacterized protein YabE (DUF348 family)